MIGASHYMQEPVIAMSPTHGVSSSSCFRKVLRWPQAHFVKRHWRYFAVAKRNRKALTNLYILAQATSAMNPSQ